MASKSYSDEIFTIQKTAIKLGTYSVTMIAFKTSYVPQHAPVPMKNNN